MPITAAQLEKRKTRLGSSDMAVLLGVDDRRNAYDLWLEKTGKLEGEAKSNASMEAGKMLENAVLDYAQGELGKLTRNQFRVAHGLDFPLGANVDAIIATTGEPVEAKSSGLPGVWGEPMTDEVPDTVIVQGTVHMICTAQITCHVPVIISRFGFQFQRYVVPFDPDIANEIQETGHNFWHNHVLADIPPENLTPNLAIIKRVRREPTKVVPVDFALIHTWQEHRNARLAAEKQEKAALAEILTAIGDAESGECAEGAFTYLESHRAGYEVKPTTYRTARFKRAKEYDPSSLSEMELAGNPK